MVTERERYRNERITVMFDFKHVECLGSNISIYVTLKTEIFTGFRNVANTKIHSV